MKRNVSLADISDGRLYGENDMVKADCRGCSDCSDCCHGMGESIILDPYDICRMTGGLGKSMAELLSEGAVELNNVDGVILPNLRMVGEEEKCTFLNSSGRCAIHPCRPGICRLFPLGRFYLENGDFKYFLQTRECKAGKSKAKVNKWIDTPAVPTYHRFIVQWHALLKQVEDEVFTQLTRESEAELEYCKQLTMGLLQIFFLAPYNSMDTFYEEFEKRYNIFCETFSIRHHGY